MTSFTLIIVERAYIYDAHCYVLRTEEKVTPICSDLITTSESKVMFLILHTRKDIRGTLRLKL